VTDEGARRDYEEFKRRGMRLDMSRGKPAPEQLDLSKPLLGVVEGFTAVDGTDARNYGLVLGLPEARALFSSLLDVPTAQVVAAGNSSLELMHDVIVFATLHGIGGHKPWKDQGKIKFLCPVPGYDRHFSICQAYGIEMIPVPMNAQGPDLAAIEKLVASDASIKGMWCVPKYSNPGGEVYGDAVVNALAQLKIAAPDFILMWDDAYRLHHLTDKKRAVANVVEACAKAGTPNRAITFASTSKITFAGAGVAALASSADNIAWWQKHVSVRTIGPDKVNQLRHVRYLKDKANVEALMDKHRAILKPKFDAVEREFAAQLSNVPNVSWTHPEGGYFIDLVTPPGRARRTIELAQAIGITLTGAGAAFPYGKDPEDRHIRIAPSYPSLDEIATAAKGVALALRVAIAE
jgi:DNA-binding transcriptional MocR family regulator